MCIIITILLFRNSVVESMRLLDREKDRYTDIEIPLQVLKFVINYC